MLQVPAVFAHRWYGNAILDWLTAAAVLAGVWLALFAVRRLGIRRLERSAARTASPLDDLLLGALRRTSKTFLFIVALAAGAHVALELRPNADKTLDAALRLAFVLQLASWGSGGITFWLDHAARDRAQRDKASLTTLNVLGILARTALWTIIVLLALDTLHINITALVTGLGIAGVAVALAVQNVLGDLFASLSIALDKPFVIGDAIAVDNFTGTVEDIGLKTTRLRALSGETLVFSNADLLKSRIRNYRGQAERRVVLTLTLAPDTPPDRAERVPPLVREIVTAEETARFDRAHLSAVNADGSLVIEVVYFVTTGDYGVHMDMKQRIYLELLRRLADERIALAKPTPPVVVNGV